MMYDAGLTWFPPRLLTRKQIYVARRDDPLYRSVGDCLARCAGAGAGGNDQRSKGLSARFERKFCRISLAAVSHSWSMNESLRAPFRRSGHI